MLTDLALRQLQIFLIKNMIGKYSSQPYFATRGYGSPVLPLGLKEEDPVSLYNETNS